MARKSTQYVCQACGECFSKWTGKCESCQSWNTLVEEAAPEVLPKGLGSGKGRKIDFTSLEGQSEDAPRLVTEIAEFDRVTGGGLVPGSVLLVGGDPGIGKSTVLLQVAAAISKKGKCAYISGEEAIDQVRLRAQRLGVEKCQVDLASTTNVRDIVSTLDDPQGPDVAIIDSIQTMYMDTLDSTPGTVSQVRGCSQELIRVAKRRGVTVILVGHVTKEGVIAGPRVLEHMVDTVLYFEGERGHQFRILRSVKNRFGATDEIGVFEMTDKGLMEVPNPSALFLTARQGQVSGASVFAGIEGTRPILVEVQALVAPSNLATPRRAVVGWDHNRLSMILAVLEARCGVNFVGRDVYLNVAGGLRVTEPAADLAVAAALLSSLSNIPTPHDAIFFGEIGLSGEVRMVGQQDARLKEAQKLGFQEAFIPTVSKGKKISSDMQIHSLSHLAELVSSFMKNEPKKVSHGS